MGIIGNLIVKGASTAAKNSTIRAVGSATASVISATANNRAEKKANNGTITIYPSRPYGEYYGKNALDIAQELLGVGFQNIGLKPNKSLSEFSKRKYGKISFISINGKRDFRETHKFPVSAFVVIEYFDFKNEVNQTAYSNSIRIIPGVIHSFADIEAMSRGSNSYTTSAPYSVSYDTPNSTPNATKKKFCTRCGHPIPSQTSKFCSHCGEPI